MFQRPLSLCSTSIRSSPDATGSASRWSHTRYFSQSHALQLRRTYFPSKKSTGGPRRSENLFSQMKATINGLPSNVILWTVLGLNGAVYVLWNVGIFQAVGGFLTPIFIN